MLKQLKNNLIYHSKIGFILGGILVLILGFGSYFTKATWQASLPGGGTDTNLYINGIGNLTNDKRNSTVSKVYQISPSNSIVAFYQTSCPTGRKPADGTNSTPDLRGVFLRGLNTFDNGTTTRSTLSGDSQSGRVLGSYQTDQFQGYKTRTTQTSGNAGAATAGIIPTNNASSTYRDTNLVDDGTNGTPRTGAETRHKNTGIIYCIKI